MLSSSEWTNPWTGEKAIELVWFHLVAIEAIWATGQLTTKICNWDSLIFFETFWVFFLFGCWLFGNVLASSFGHLHQPLFSSQRAVLSQLKCAQRACEIFWDFNIRKWPLNLSQKMAEKNMLILVWFKWCSSAAWACLKPFDWFWGKKKNYSKFCISSRPFPQGSYFAYDRYNFDMKHMVSIKSSQRMSGKL